MIYFVRKTELDKLPAGGDELQRCLQRMVEQNEAIGIDRMPAEMQMQSLQLLLSNPAFSLVQVQDDYADRFVRSPLHGHANEVYLESLEVVTDYIRELQDEIIRGAESLARYRISEQDGSMERAGLRQALIDLSERREILTMVLHEIRHRIDKQMEKEKLRSTEQALESE